MSPRLRPLLLPRLVERRKLDDVQTPIEPVDGSFVFLVDNNTSSSDLATPATPTFSHRSAHGHLRCSSSSSSLDLTTSSLPLPDCAIPPICLGPTANSVSPAPTAHSGSNVSKRLLPDVQEEDLLDRDDECSLYDEDGLYEDDDDDEYLTFPDTPNLYGCLCKHCRPPASPWRPQLTLPLLPEQATSHAFTAAKTRPARRALTTTMASRATGTMHAPACAPIRGGSAMAVAAMAAAAAACPAAYPAWAQTRPAWARRLQT